MLNSPVKAGGFAIWSCEGLKLKRTPLSPSGRKPEKPPSGMTQEQKGPSGIADLPFGYEEGLIAREMED